jgi:tRNA 2-thiouridine synthesizing protein A
MSADNGLSSAIPALYHLRLEQTLPNSEQPIIDSLLSLLPATAIADHQQNCDAKQQSVALKIKALVDGRGLACPMPLLKTKLALRQVAMGESLYVVATDPNSQADIIAFCQQTQRTDTTTSLLLAVNQATPSLATTTSSAPPADTIYHFIITKTDSN